MESKQMICSGAKDCNYMCQRFSTEITCVHKRPHDFTRPKYKTDPRQSCVAHRCFVINQDVKCVPYKEEDNYKYRIKPEELDDVDDEKESSEVKKDNDFECPIGLKCYSHTNENCQFCDLQNMCVDFMFCDD